MALSGKSVTKLLVVWCGVVLLATAQSFTADKYQEIRLGSATYVSLAEWARRSGFSVDWRRESKIVYVSSKWTKFTFNVTSKKASLNDLSVWLCSPVVEYRDSLYVSERDVEKTLRPILYPQKLEKGRRVRTIALAAGHGGKDPGNIVNRHQEKTYTLLLAQALKKELLARGFKVIMTRENDTFVDLEPQAEIARKAKADLFIALHYNAVADIDPKGVETFALTPAGAIYTNGGSPSPWSSGNRYDPFNIFLAHQVHKSVLQKTDFEDRGIRRAQFLVLRELHMPGILVEGGFMSNPSDAKKIFSAAHRQIVAQTIADGISSYKSRVERN